MDPVASSPQDLLNHIADAATATQPHPMSATTAVSFPPGFSFMSQETGFPSVPPFESSSDPASLCVTRTCAVYLHTSDRSRAAQTYKQVGPLGFGPSAFDPLPGFQTQHSPDSREGRFFLRDLTWKERTIGETSHTKENETLNI